MYPEDQSTLPKPVRTNWLWQAKQQWFLFMVNNLKPEKRIHVAANAFRMISAGRTWGVIIYTINMREIRGDESQFHLDCPKQFCCSI